MIKNDASKRLSVFDHMKTIVSIFQFFFTVSNKKHIFAIILIAVKLMTVKLLEYEVLR